MQFEPVSCYFLQDNTTNVQGSSSSNQFTTPPIKTISYEAMKERRDKGLCYYCDEKFWPRHHCKTQTLYMLVGQTSLEDDNMDYSDDQPSSNNNVPEISMLAMTGAPTPQTM